MQIIITISIYLRRQFSNDDHTWCICSQIRCSPYPCSGSRVQWWRLCRPGPWCRTWCLRPCTCPLWSILSFRLRKSFHFEWTLKSTWRHWFEQISTNFISIESSFCVLQFMFWVREDWAKRAAAKSRQLPPARSNLSGVTRFFWF